MVSSTAVRPHCQASVLAQGFGIAVRVKDLGFSRRLHCQGSIPVVVAESTAIKSYNKVISYNTVHHKQCDQHHSFFQQ